MQIRETITHLYNKYKDLIPYVFFGVCTTLVNTATYWFCAHVLSIQVMLSTILAWFFAVLFAFITNRRWVFHSQAHAKREIVREAFVFYICRLSTGFIDWCCMYFLVGLLPISDVIIKFGANVLVIVLNYIASKFIVFRK